MTEWSSELINICIDDIKGWYRGWWRESERVIDGVRLNEWKDRWWWLVGRSDPCAWSHWTIPPSPSLRHFLSAWAESIHHLIDSVLLLPSFKPHQVRTAVDFSCAAQSARSASIPSFLSLDSPPTHPHPRGISRIVFGLLLSLQSICCPHLFVFNWID